VSCRRAIDALPRIVVGTRCTFHVLDEETCARHHWSDGMMLKIW
jgi:hypothetical protein